jgi:hypothetical protein
MTTIRTVAAVMLCLSASATLATHDSNTFNEDTLNPPKADERGFTKACEKICVTTFAKNFTTNAFGPFGMLFLPDNSVIVTDPSFNGGQIYHFPNDVADTDGICQTIPPVTAGGHNAPSFVIQTNNRILDLAFSYDGRIFGTADGIVREYQFTGSALVIGKTDPATGVFTPNPAATICVTPPFTFGIGRDPVSGRIYWAGNSQVSFYDPFTDTCGTFHAGAPFANDADGLAWSEKGAFLWVAALNTGVVQFTIGRDSKGIPDGSLGSVTTLCPGFFSGPDGIAKGLPGTCLENYVCPNNNDGTLGRIDLRDPANCQKFLQGGTRGDFVKAHKGWLYATQKASIALVRTPSPALPLFENTPGGGPAGPEELRSFCDNLVLRGCIHNAKCQPLANAIDIIKASPGSVSVNAANMLRAEINQLCTVYTGVRPLSDCDRRLRALIIAIDAFLQSHGFTGNIPATCPI